MTYVFDIDGTLCQQFGADYESAIPYPDRIKVVNKLYKEGHKIILHTARGWTTKINWKALTERQLSEWNVMYHELVMGKPGANLYIDDKGENANVFFKE